MAHPPLKKLFRPDPFSQSKTLFLVAPGGLGILVEIGPRKTRQTTRRFRDPHAALAWCLEHRAGLVLSWPPAVPPQPARN